MFHFFFKISGWKVTHHLPKDVLKCVIVAAPHTSNWDFIYAMGALKEMKIKTKISDLKFWGTNKDRFQIEVPIASCNKVPSEWTTKSQKKTHRRYWTPVIEELLGDMIQAEDREKEAQKDTLRKVFET